MNTVAEMPRYKCHKEVQALKIKSVEWECQPWQGIQSGPATLTFEDERYAPLMVGRQYTARNMKLAAGGYYVVYDDGYQSYSPAEAFEAGYSLIAP